MAKRDAKRDTKGELPLTVAPEETFYGLCSTFPETQSKSPNPKKLYVNKNKTNADIVRAIHQLNACFIIFEQRINKNAADIKQVKEEIQRLGFQAKKTEDRVEKLVHEITKRENRGR